MPPPRSPSALVTTLLEATRAATGFSSLRSPLRRFAALLAVAFVAEFGTMMALSAPAPAPRAALLALVDAGALTAVLAAGLWWLVIRPIRRAAVNGAHWAEHLMSEAADPIIAINERGRIEFANSAATRAFGYELPQMLGRSVSMLMPFPHREQHDDYLARFIATGEQRTIGRREVEAQRRDGTTFPVELAVSEVQVGGSRLFTVVLRDLAERWRAQDSARRVAFALRESADNVVITDRDGVIVWVNRALETTSGYAAEEIIGGTPRILRSGRQGPGFYEALWKTILAGKVFRGVMINRRKTGELYYLDQTITPIRDGSGQVSQFIANGRLLSEP